MSDDSAQVATKLQEWSRLYKEGDMEKLWSTMYKEGASFMPTGFDAITGKEAIAALKSFKEQGAHDFKIDVVESVIREDLAVERGNYELLTKEGKSHERGKYVTVFQKVGGKWLIIMDIFNSKE